MKDRTDRYEEDTYYRKEERDDPTDEDRKESLDREELDELNECLREIARLTGELRESE